MSLVCVKLKAPLMLKEAHDLSVNHEANTHLLLEPWAFSRLLFLFWFDLILYKTHSHPSSCSCGCTMPSGETSYITGRGGSSKRYTMATVGGLGEWPLMRTFEIYSCTIRSGYIIPRTLLKNQTSNLCVSSSWKLRCPGLVEILLQY